MILAWQFPKTLPLEERGIAERNDEIQDRPEQTSASEQSEQTTTAERRADYAPGATSRELLPNAVESGNVRLEAPPPPKLASESDSLARRSPNVRGENAPERKFRGVIGPKNTQWNLFNRDLRGWDLRGANFNHAFLKGADLRNSDLSGANLKDANLNGADLAGAILTGANVTNAQLEDALNLTQVQLDLACVVTVQPGVRSTRPPRLPSGMRAPARVCEPYEGWKTWPK